MSNAARKTRKMARRWDRYLTGQAEALGIDYTPVIPAFQHPKKGETTPLVLRGGMSNRARRRRYDTLMGLAASSVDEQPDAGVTVELDPTPYVRDGERYAAAPGRFRPRASYSQDRADYTTGA